MYCIEVTPRSLSTLRRTRRRGIDIEPLLPREERVVDLERAAPDLDRPLHAARRDAGVDEAEPSVERLRPFLVHAHRQSEAVVAARHGGALGGARQCRADAAATMLREHLDVADLGRVGDLEMCMADGIVALPRDEVDVVALQRQPREPEAGGEHARDVLGHEQADVGHRSLDRNVRAPPLSSMSFRLPHFGLWTHEGQPSAQGQPRIIRAVSATQPSNWSKPRCVMPTPPGCPSYTNTVGRPVWKWRFVERPPMSQRSHIAQSGNIAIIACSAACSVASSVGICSSPSSWSGSGRYHTA